MTKFKSLPPIERLQELFCVGEDGRLLCRRRPHPHSRSKIGDEVGTLHPSGYRKVVIDGSAYMTHRIIWLLTHGKDPGDKEIDHINRIKDDNRPENLRLATSQQNKLNRGCFLRSKSGRKGVRKRFWGQSYRWEASFGGEYIGSYETAEEAVSAWEQVAKARSGEFFCFRQNAD